MRIVYLHQYFRTPDMSGGTRSYEFGRRLASAGHDVHVVTSSSSLESTSGWSTYEVDGITVHTLGVPYDNAMSYTRRIRSFMSFAFRASFYARRLDGDLVYATSTPLTIAIPGVAASWPSVPMVFEVRDLWPEVPIALGAIRGRLPMWLARALASFAYRNAHAVVALSSGMADGVRAAGYTGTVEVIPNSCDNALFSMGETAAREFRDAREWLRDRPLVVYTGTFGRVNGVSYMAELAHEYMKIDPEVRFLALGDGAELSRVRARAEQLNVLHRNFFIEGSQPKRDMPGVLKAATVCSSWVVPVPELEANSANKFFDALAAHRPIIINHGGWMKELIDAESIGVALDPVDIELAARELAEFIRDDSRLERARSRAGELASETFGRDRLSNQLRELLERSAAGPGARQRISTHTIDRGQHHE